MANIQRFDPKLYGERKRFSFGKLFSLFFLIIFLLTLGYSFLQYLSYKDFNKKGSGEGKKVFEVKEGESLDMISQRLVKEGFLKDKNVFIFPAYKVYLKLNPEINTNNVQVGNHDIPLNSTPSEVFSNLRAKGCEEVQVTFREGWRIEEFAEELDKVFKSKNSSLQIYNKNEFIQLAKNYTSDTSSLNLSFTPPANLEGYLFPDTYRFCIDISTESIINKLLQNFNSKVYLPLQSEILASEFRLDQIVNIASMIEREARSIEAKGNVADVMIKRLNEDIPLGIDATTQYGFGYSDVQNTWWRKDVELDLVIDLEHPYNTRKNLGLPPTPISNPGIDSIKSVLNPIKNSYYYYITGNDGKMYYAETGSEHDVNVCRYITESCN